jgi:hypothetical protein
VRGEQELVRVNENPAAVDPILSCFNPGGDYAVMAMITFLIGSLLQRH